jgi:hypothetical protein
MANEWTLFVKKIYKEGKAKNPDYKFKQALVEASKRKGEMGSSASSSASSSSASSSSIKKSKSAAASTKKRNSMIALTGGKRSGSKRSGSKRRSGKSRRTRRNH